MSSYITWTPGSKRSVGFYIRKRITYSEMKAVTRSTSDFRRDNGFASQITRNFCAEPGSKPVRHSAVPTRSTDSTFRRFIAIAERSEIGIVSIYDVVTQKCRKLLAYPEVGSNEVRYLLSSYVKTIMSKIMITDCVCVFLCGLQSMFDTRRCARMAACCMDLG